jgi:aspartate racemase
MMIGIVGGVGPYAGLDLMKKVFDQTLALKDQDHLDTMLLSLPSGILDRTEYLEGRVEKNPAFAIANVLARLEEAGASVAGIPCNTAHTDKIFEVILSELKRGKRSIKVLNMVSETVSFIQSRHSSLNRIGVLSTTGTYKSRVYVEALENQGFQVLVPEMEMQETLIHPAIYDPVYGIKSQSDPIHPQAKENLQRGFDFLESRGAQGVILGCTEIPLAFPAQSIGGMTAIDPTLVLARALINYSNPNKLKPLK